MTKSDMDRDYHVFLFEKIILCCKEYFPVGPNAKKMNKTNSILKKQGVPAPLSIPGGPNGKKKNTALLLKGRIFLNNVTSAVPKVNAGQCFGLSSLGFLVLIESHRPIFARGLLEGGR